MPVFYFIVTAIAVSSLGLLASIMTPGFSKPGNQGYLWYLLVLKSRLSKSKHIKLELRWKGTVGALARMCSVEPIGVGISVHKRFSAPFFACCCLRRSDGLIVKSS